MADEEALREAQRVSADAEALYAKVQQTRAQLDGLKTETRSMLTALTDREFQLQERLYELARLKLQGVAIDDQLQAKWELLNN
jgi:hypothetical protein